MPRVPRDSGYRHCPRCRLNVDAVICPRCATLTAKGLLQVRRVRRQVEGCMPLEVYRCALKQIREGGVDVEAS